MDYQNIVRQQPKKETKDVDLKIFEYILDQTENINQQHITRQEQVIVVPSSRKKQKSSKSKHKKKTKVLDSDAELIRAQLLSGIVDKMKQVNTVNNTTVNHETDILTQNLSKLQVLIKETIHEQNHKNTQKNAEDSLLKELIKEINKQSQHKIEQSQKKKSTYTSRNSIHTQNYPEITKSQHNYDNKKSNFKHQQQQIQNIRQNNANNLYSKPPSTQTQARKYPYATDPVIYKPITTDIRFTEEVQSKPNLNLNLKSTPPPFQDPNAYRGTPETIQQSGFNYRQIGQSGPSGYNRENRNSVDSRYSAHSGHSAQSAGSARSNNSIQNKIKFTFDSPNKDYVPLNKPVYNVYKPENLNANYPPRIQRTPPKIIPEVIPEVPEKKQNHYLSPYKERCWKCRRSCGCQRVKKIN